MALVAFWLLLVLIIFDGILPVSAYPVPIPQSDVSVHISSGPQQQESAPTLVIFPSSLGSAPYESTTLKVTTTSVNKGVTDESQLSKRDESETPSLDENGETEGGLNPNIIAGIAIGATFGVLLIIAALMYAFRIGWEKGQKQKEKTAHKAPSQPPAPPVLEPWNQMDVITPPDAILETGSGSWDGGSWSCCDEQMEKYKTLGERYSFRPGKGVYEIQEKDLENVGDAREAWSTGGSSKTDSGLGLGEEGKGKGHEKLCS